MGEFKNAWSIALMFKLSWPHVDSLRECHMVPTRVQFKSVIKILKICYSIQMLYLNTYKASYCETQ